MENRKVVVTGGAGFIGSHLARRLAERNRCVVVDDLSTGKFENIEADVSEGRFEFVEGSILDLELLQGLFADVDYVFHQAAMVSVPRSLDRPVACAMTNVIGTLNVLQAATNNGVGKVICASSSSVYGDTPDLPKNERAKPNPLSPYAVSKLAVEHYCDVLGRSNGLSTVCLRYFNAYGPAQDPTSQYAAVIPRFMRRILDGEPPIIFGDGSQTRDFTFVEDVVTANILCAEGDHIGVFNVGTQTSISITDLALLIADLAGSALTPVHTEQRSGDVIHSLADISKVSAIGYAPECSLSEGLRLSLEYIAKNGSERLPSRSQLAEPAERG